MGNIPFLILLVWNDILLVLGVPDSLIIVFEQRTESCDANADN